MSRWLVIFCLPIFLSQSTNGHRGPSRIPISVTPPNLPGGFVAAGATPGPFLKGFKPPFPTDSWWAGFTVKNQDATAAGPFPFQSRTANNGFEFGIGTARSYDGKSLKVPRQMDLSVSIAKLSAKMDNRKATAWDTQTVSLQYMADDGSTMDTTLVPGSPYMTFTFNKSQVVLRSIRGNIGFQWNTQGNNGRVTCGGGVYLLYVIGGSLNEFTTTKNTLTFTTEFTGTIRLAKLVNAEQESILDTYAATYPTSLSMSYDVQGDLGTTTWTWDVVGDPTKLLIMSWPHHRKVLVSPTYVNIEYLNVKGRMKGVLGNQWVQKFNLPPISWKATLLPHNSCVAELQKTLEYEVNSLQSSVPGEFYIWGGRVAAGATLATIADTLGRTDLRNRVLAVLKQSIDHWFQPNRTPAAAYETRWGGLVDRRDVSNLHYNDHHFLYGYFLYASAIVAKFDSDWLAQHLNFLNHMARDIGNPSPDDPHYTVSRHMDFFHGHSWASGLQNGAGPRNQESSSEAINGYYGLLLFGDVTGNTELVKWSRLLLALEIMGAQTYWHLYPNAANPDEPYPEKDFRKLVTVGNVYADGVSRFLHWGSSKKIQVAAIQIIPVTPMGEVNYDKEWMEEVLPYCSSELNNDAESDVWKSVIYAAYAKVNPQLAYNYSSELTSWGSGNTASNQLYFVSTQPARDTANICSNIVHTPEGLFTIQDLNSGNYVGISNGKLKANLQSNLISTKFQLGFIPGGGTIQSTSSSMYVTASKDGRAGLAANRKVANSFEIFRWKQVEGGYELKAMVNKRVVNTGTGGELWNNASTAGKYILAATTLVRPIVPKRGKLQNVQSKKFVVANTKNPTLVTSESAVNGGTTFRFEKVGDTEFYTIWSTANGLAVTGNPSGNVPLRAGKSTAKSWEYFRVVADNGQYIFVHEPTGMAVTLKQDGTLLNNDSTVGNGARWNIIS